ESKGYANADEFKDFCNATVPLARMPQRVYTTADKLNVDVELAHFGAEPMKDGKAVWQIDDVNPAIQGEWDTTTFPIGKNIRLGKISVDLSKVGVGEHKLKVTVAPEFLFGSGTGTFRKGDEWG